MTRDEALAVLQRNLETTREALDVILATRPQGVIESEAKRVGGGDLETPSGGDRDASAAPPSPAPLLHKRSTMRPFSRCGERAPAPGFEIIGDRSYPALHECWLPAGHGGDCVCVECAENFTPFPPRAA